MKLCQAFVVMCVLVVGTLSWAYPVDVTQDLTPDVKTVVHVASDGVTQFASVQFMAENGPLGSVYLSSMIPMQRSLRYYMSDNKILTVSSLRFQAASILSDGRIVCSGYVRDNSGGPEQTFHLIIAQWTN